MSRIPFTESPTKKHPRLFFNDELLKIAKARAQTDLTDYYKWIYSRAKMLANEPTHAEDHGIEAAETAMIYLITGEPEFFDTAKNLLAASIRHYRLCDQNNREVDWFSTSRINAICAYDWLYNGLSQTDRISMGRDLLAHVAAVQPGRGKNVKGRNYSDHTDGYYGTRSLVWYAGIAFYGEGIDDTLALTYIKRGYEDYTNLLEYRKQLAGDDGGLSSYSLNYEMGACPWAEFNFFHTLKSAYGIDMAQQWPYLALWVNYILWNRLPGNRWFGSGDAYHDTNRLPEWQSYTHFAQIRHFYGRSQPVYSALAAWFGGSLEKQNFINTWPAVPFLLFGLDELTPKSPSKFNFPQARHFENLGQIFMHSGWGDDDTYVQFTSGGKVEMHKHFDENSLAIFANGFLALDSGSRPEPGSHLSHYYCRTIAHNSVLIYMPGEKMPKYWSAGYAPGEPELPVPNDGGQNKCVGSRLAAFETCPDYTYAAGDATGSYHPGKCALFLRQLVFVPPRHIVVFDRVVSQKSGQKKTWVLHTAKKPEITGRAFAANHESGRMFCQTLLPEKPEISLVGGTAPFQSGGRNWPLPKDFQIRNDHELLGQWRVEVRPTDDGRETFFLHVIEAGPAKHLAQAGDVSLVSEGRMRGVEIKGKNQKIFVVFSTDGEPSGHIRISEGKTKIVDRPLTQKVKKQSGLAFYQTD